FGKYGRQLGLIGEAVQPGNEAIKPRRQENQIAARLSLPISGRRNGGDEDPGFFGGGEPPRRKAGTQRSLQYMPCFVVRVVNVHIGGTGAAFPFFQISHFSPFLRLAAVCLVRTAGEDHQFTAAIRLTSS